MTARRIAVDLLVALALLGLASCSKSDTDRNKRLVHDAFDAMASNEVTQYLVLSDDMTERMATTTTYRPYFHVKNTTLTVSPDKPDVVHYACTIPGPVGVAFCLATGRYYSLNDKYCRRIAVEGELRIVTDARGNRRIVVTDGSDPFSLYLALRYPAKDALAFNSVVQPDGRYASDEALSAAIALSMAFVSSAYKDVLPAELGGEPAFKRAFVRYVESLEQIVRSSTDELPSGVGPNPRLGALWGWLKAYWGVILVVVIVAAAAVAGAVDKAGKGLEKRRKRREQALVDSYCSLLHLPSDAVPLTDVCRSSQKEGMDDVIRRLMSGADPNRVVGLGMHEKAILFSFKPTGAKRVILALYREFRDGVSNPDAMRSDESICGWCACALGRCLTHNLKPGRTRRHQKRFAGIRRRHEKRTRRLRAQHEKGVERYRDIQRRLTAAPQPRGQRDEHELKRLKKAMRRVQKRLHRLEARLAHDAFVRAIRRGVRPVDFLEHVACDMHGYAKYVRQGAMMGLIPFLVKHQAHEQVGPILKHVVQARSDMISSDQQMSFFQVRAPEYCTAEGYAVILDEVLRCANPSIAYADAREIVMLAVKEIPGVLGLLAEYPLRLIDPVNKKTEGFYKFTPFRHAQWVQYVPPLNEGQVIRRYHEALDMTLPNSTGLNLDLFKTTHDVIPVLFHEFCHYKKDSNEASVFLRTQLFCRYFYRTYREADPKRNFVFVFLQSLLGPTPDPKKAEKLNELIVKYYGERVPELVAEKAVEDMLNGMNARVREFNSAVTWCPDKTLPLLTVCGEEGDAYTRQIIHDASMRAYTAPRSITQSEFEYRLEHWRALEESECIFRVRAVCDLG